MTGPSRRFLVLHGWQNHRPRHHWQWLLTEELRSRGEQVLYPQLPDADLPSLAAWTNLLLDELAQLGERERVVVAHSLSAVLWLHAAPLIAAAGGVDRVLLVGIPGRHVLAAHQEVLDFAGLTVDVGAVRRACGSTRLVHSDNDPYCPEGAQHAFGGLDLDADVVSGAAHLDIDAGYGRWPAMLDWCLAPSTRLTAR